MFLIRYKRQIKCLLETTCYIITGIFYIKFLSIMQ